MKNPLDYLRSGGIDHNDNVNYNDDIICERLVKKIDVISIEIAGLNFGGFQLGKFGIEPKLLQTVGHALMLLDASQYDLCNSIKNIKDEETRQKYELIFVYFCFLLETHFTRTSDYVSQN